MQKRCTNSGCRAQLPRRALHCPRCGRKTGRVSQRDLGRMESEAHRQSRREWARLVEAALAVVDDAPGEEIRLTQAYFHAWQARKRVLCVKALMNANDLSAGEALALIRVLYPKDWAEGP